MGLCDVALMQEYQYGLRQGMEKYAPEVLMMSWILGTGDGWEQLQKTVWSQFTGIRSTE